MKESSFLVDAPSLCDSGYILGDSTYPLMPWFMTLYRDNEQQFPSWQKNFNVRHSQQRACIENAFGLLKQHFRQLYLVDAKTVAMCCYAITAACVLHNLCNDGRDLL